MSPRLLAAAICCPALALAGCGGGLILRSTLAFNVTFALTRTDAGKVIELAFFSNGSSRTDGAGATRSTVAAVPFDGTSAHLKVSCDGHENATFSFSTDGCRWQTVGGPSSVGLALGL